jgi:hypothetical protein
MELSVNEPDERRDHNVERGIDVRIILKGIIRKWYMKYVDCSFGSGYRPVIGCYEHGNGPSVSLESGNYLTSKATKNS